MSESLSVALRAAIRAPLAEACADHIERSRVVVRLIVGTPALYARWLEQQTEVGPRWRPT